MRLARHDSIKVLAGGRVGGGAHSRQQVSALSQLTFLRHVAGRRWRWRRNGAFQGFWRHFKDNSFISWLYMLTGQLTVSREAGQEVESGTGCCDSASCVSSV